MKTRIIVFLIVLCWTLPFFVGAEQMSQDQIDDDRVAAAYALFGAGLESKVDEKNKTLTIKWGKLTEEMSQRWIVEYYLPALTQAAPSSAIFDGERQIMNFDYRNILNRGGTSWMILEPHARGELCRQIARQIKNDSKRKELDDYCLYAAVYIADRTLYEFRGKEVIWDPTRDLVEHYG